MKNKIWWVAAAVVIIAGISAWSLSHRPTNDMLKDQAMDKAAGDTTGKDENGMMTKSGSYKDYSASTLAAEQTAGHKVVLFFHANWCPTCKAADAAFRKEALAIPEGVTLLETDYDSEKDLKIKYVITTQHTFVQIDGQGKQIAKWIGGDIPELKANLK